MAEELAFEQARRQGSTVDGHKGFVFPLARKMDCFCDYFFAGAREKPLVAIVRKKERVQLPDRPGSGPAMYRFESLDFAATERRFNAYYAEFLPASAEKLRPHAHPGAEFILVVQGSLGLQVGADEYLLEAGDSVYFDSSEPHAYRRAAGRACSAVVVTAP